MPAQARRVRKLADSIVSVWRGWAHARMVVRRRGGAKVAAALQRRTRRVCASTFRRWVGWVQGLGRTRALLAHVAGRRRRLDALASVLVAWAWLCAWKREHQHKLAYLLPRSRRACLTALFRRWGRLTRARRAATRQRTEQDTRVHRYTSVRAQHTQHTRIYIRLILGVFFRVSVSQF